MPQNKPSIGCAIITHNAKRHLPQCLPPLLKSSLSPKVVVVNSSSNDGTVELAQSLGADTLVIPRAEFNHGLTREKARKYLNTDIVVMITPDAYLEDHFTLEKLVAPLIENRSSIVYARQIGHHGADFFEEFPRTYNYPETSHTRGIENLSQYGVYTFFCSDSCAAYKNSALDEIGGFPHVLLGEDTVAVAKLLKKGHKITYVAEAVARHSHRYTIKEEFCRSFDTGIARQGYGYLFEGASDSRRGINYVKEMSRQLLKKAPHLLPYAWTHAVAKWLGYQMGKRSLNAPIWFKKRFSTQDFYWDNL